MRSQLQRILSLANGGASADLLTGLPRQAYVAASAAAPALLQAQRSVQASPSSSNAANVVSNITSVLTSTGATPQDISDAALALSYLQAQAPRRAWGIVLEKALEQQAAFDAAAFANLLQAISAAGVEHHRTLYELSAQAQKLLGSFTPAQVGYVAEAFGKAGVSDVALFDAITSKVSAGIKSFSPADLARVLYGLAASGSADTAAAKAISAQLAAAADQLSAAETSQAVWALATLQLADKATLDALVKSAAGKLGKGEAAGDVAALLWGAATLGYSAPQLVSKGAAALKAGAAKLTAGQAIAGAWSLAVLGSGDKDTVGALFAVAAKALAAAPEKVPLADVAKLYEASAILPDAGLAPAAAKYSEYVYSLVQERQKLTAPQAVKDFTADLAQATAAALGAKYRPEVEAKVAAFPTAITPGLLADIAFDKTVVQPVSTGEPAGATNARAKVAAAAGYKVVLVPQAEFSALADAAAKAKYLQAKLK